MSDFFRSQVPYGTSLALNATMRDVRRHIVGSTYPKAFQVRNRAFPGTMFRIEFSRKNDLQVTLYDRLGREYMERHSGGGVKRPAAGGGNLAIPVGIQRTKTGRIPKRLKPRSITSKNTGFVVKGKSGAKLIVERSKGETVVRYVLKPSAKIKKSFRFYEESMKIADRVIDSHWNQGMTRALKTSRVFSGL